MMGDPFRVVDLDWGLGSRGGGYLAVEAAPGAVQRWPEIRRKMREL
jgi:hypothetical protein